MSGGISATTIATVAAAAIAGGASIYSANKQASATKAAAQAQSDAAIAAAPKPQQQAKAPDQNTINAGLGIGTGTNNLGAADQSSNTLLTGAQGVQDPLSLSARRLYGANAPGLLGG